MKGYNLCIQKSLGYGKYIELLQGITQFLALHPGSNYEGAERKALDPPFAHELFSMYLYTFFTFASVSMIESLVL